MHQDFFLNMPDGVMIGWIYFTYYFPVIYPVAQQNFLKLLESVMPMRHSSPEFI